jgi:hypothetical protein
LSSSTASADIELASRDSSEEMSEAASENGNVRAERATVEFRGKGSWAYLIASPAPAGAILCQQLLEDAGLERIQILWKIERQCFLARFIFKSAVTTATSKLGG